jgi:hypothetical protein
MDSREQGFRPLQPPTEVMVDSKAISDASFVLPFGPLLLDLIKSCPPLRIRVLYWD